uniref:Uncharacterized protein n=1 Tax=Anguilla anguilla TaxID=7936 RepID=A0A0E9X2K3_ANGAN
MLFVALQSSSPCVGLKMRGRGVFGNSSQTHAPVFVKTDRGFRRKQTGNPSMRVKTLQQQQQQRFLQSQFAAPSTTKTSVHLPLHHLTERGGGEAPKRPRKVFLFIFYFFILSLPRF